MLNWILTAIGWMCVGLALAGLMLPVLPCTPFALLAAACFSRSSPAAYQRLLTSPLLGPVLRDWQEHRAVTLRAKLVIFAIAAVAAGMTFVGRPTHTLSQGFAMAGLLLVAVVLLALPTIKHRHPKPN